MRIFAQHCQAVTDGRAILDVGAHRGEYAMLAKRVRPGAEVVAFEPCKRAVEGLRKRCEPMGVDVVPAAVGDFEGSVQFREGRDSALGAVIEDGESREGGVSSDRTYPVEQVTIDGWRGRRGVEVALLKIDVEGGEAGVLRGAVETLRSCAPTILCEILSDQAGAAVVGVLGRSYYYYAIDELGGYKQAESVRRTSFRNRNWLLVPRKWGSVA